MILDPIVFLQVPLRSSSDDLTARGNLTIIGAAMRLHAPPENSAQDLTRRHVPPCASTRQVPLADVSPSDVITATSSADVIVEQTVDQR